MGLFGSNPHVSNTEFDKVRARLSFRGMDKKKLADVEKVFHGDMAEPGDHSGVEKKELETGLRWMRENKHKHGLDDDDIDQVEEAMRSKI